MDPLAPKVLNRFANVGAYDVERMIGKVHRGLALGIIAPLKGLSAKINRDPSYKVELEVVKDILEAALVAEEVIAFHVDPYIERMKKVLER